MKRPGGQIMAGRIGIAAAATLLLAGCIPNQEFQPAPDSAPPRYSASSSQDDRPFDQTDQTGYRAQPLSRPQPWELRPATPDAQAVADGDYVVQPGDTLRGIAGKTGAGSEAIARTNGITAPFVVFVGQRLHIPGGRYHLVRPGQTGIAIARAYHLPWSRIVDANELVEPYVLRAGQRIVIPARDPATDSARTDNGANERSPVNADRSLQLVIDDIVTGGQPAAPDNGKLSRPAKSSRDLPPADVPIATPSHLAGSFVWPVDGPVIKRFGPGTTGVRNDGIKIAVPIDTPVHAAADGVVAYTGEGVAGLGGLVIVRHGDGWTSVYGHADRIVVQRGQAVKRGQTIALSGETGYANQPELHFELRQGRTPVDPLSRLPVR
jgi:murein DD-endopeptidase MepM/ murein hydrolase activator NlpD